MILDSLWFDTWINKAADAVTEWGMILGQAVLVSAVWLLPPSALFAALAACGISCGWPWLVVWLGLWSVAIWFAERQSRRQKAAAADRIARRPAATT